MQTNHGSFSSWTVFVCCKRLAPQSWVFIPGGHFSSWGICKQSDLQYLQHIAVLRRTRVALQTPDTAEPGGICSFGSPVSHRVCEFYNNIDHGPNMAGAKYGMHTKSLQGPLQRLMHSEAHKTLIVGIFSRAFLSAAKSFECPFFVVVFL